MRKAERVQATLDYENEKREFDASATLVTDLVIQNIFQILLIWTRLCLFVWQPIFSSNLVPMTERIIMKGCFKVSWNKKLETYPMGSGSQIEICSVPGIWKAAQVVC